MLMNNYVERRNFHFEFMVPFLVAMLLLLIPWEQLSGQAFWDLSVYREKFVSGVPVMERMDISSMGSFFVNEVLWDVFIRYLIDNIGLQVETVFSMITFVTLFSFVRFVTVRFGVLAALLLVNPIVIDLAFSQIRMAFAISLLVISIDVKKFELKWLLLMFSVFFHTAMVLFVGVYFLCSCFIKGKRVKALFGGSPVFFSLFVAMCIFLILGPLREAILSFLGDRRQGYSAEPTSFLYASFWIIYALVTLELIRIKPVLDLSVLIGFIWVVVYLLATLFGIYSLRFLSGSFPFIITSMLMFFTSGVEVNEIYRIRRFQRMCAIGVVQKQYILSGMLISLFAIYTVIQWYYWLQL